MGEPTRYQENSVRNAVLGALVGGGMALAVWEIFLTGPHVFCVVAMLVAAIVFGLLGFFLGESFVTWLREDLGWFWI